MIEFQVSRLGVVQQSRVSFQNRCNTPARGVEIFIWSHLPTTTISMNFEYIEYKNGSTAYVCRLKNCKVRCAINKDDAFSFTSTICEHDHLNEKAEIDIMSRKRIAINSALHQPNLSLWQVHCCFYFTN